MKLFNFFNKKTNEPIETITDKDVIETLTLTTPEPKDFISNKDSLSDSFDRAYKTALRQNVTIQVRTAIKRYVYGDEQVDTQAKAYEYYKQLRDNDSLECANNPQLKPRSDRELLTIIETKFDVIFGYNTSIDNITVGTFALPISLDLVINKIVTELIN